MVRAVKKIKKEFTEREKKEFLLETSSLKQLAHPNIIQIYEMFEDEAYFYLVTEFFEGLDLFDRLVEGKPMGESEIAHIIE